jgi:hypothetical protein
MVSRQLVDGWRTRLAEWQRRLDEGRPRPWVARAYVRILSYLLAQYGRQSEADAPPDAATSESPSTNQRSVIVLREDAFDHSGKPPRTDWQIRSVLVSVQVAVPPIGPGPYIDGLPVDERRAVMGQHPFSTPLVQGRPADGMTPRLRRFRRMTHGQLRLHTAGKFN